MTLCVGLSHEYTANEHLLVVQGRGKKCFVPAVVPSEKVKGWKLYFCFLLNAEGSDCREY